MASTTRVDCALLAAATLFTRFATRSRALYDIDSVNYAFALDHFDPSAHQPHPPGYYLYVLAGRAVRSLTGDANDALVALSIVASAGLAVLVYLLAREWFDRRAGVLAGALFVVSPLGWFHGTVALTYIVEAVFSALVGWLCWRAVSHSSRSGIWAATILGAASGFRPSFLLFLLPLWWLSTRRDSIRSRLLGIAAMGVSAAIWFVPMLIESGGPAVYFGALWDLWRIVPGASTGAGSWMLLSLARLATVLFILALCFGSASAFFLLRIRSELSKPQRVFVWCWITPALLFFSMVFLKFVNSGYLLLVTPPLFAILGGRAAALTRSGSQVWIKAIAGAGFAAANLAIYFFAPLYFSYGQVRLFESELATACARVRATVSPARSILVGFDSHFLGYRHAAYYLPEFTVLQYPEVRYVSGTRLFVVHSGRTSTLRSLDPEGFETIAFFPLPDDASYRAFVDRTLAVLPPASLSRTPGKPEILTAPASSLSKLFPLTIGSGLSTAVYSHPLGGNRR